MIVSKINIFFLFCIIAIDNISLVSAANYVRLIPEFPKNLGPIANDIASLRRLPTRCRQALQPNSTNAEKLSCSIISQPGSRGLFPFGTYKPEVPLFEPLSQINSKTISKVFSDYALVLLIQNGCFTYEVDFDTEASYARHLMVNSVDFQNSWNESVDTFGAYKVQSPWITSSYASTVSELALTGNSRNIKIAWDLRAWSAEFGRLILNKTCLEAGFLQKNNILDEDYLDLWRTLAKNEQSIVSAEDLSKQPAFRDIIDAGLYFPSQFSFASRFESVNTYLYNARADIDYANLKDSLSWSDYVEFFNVGLGFSKSSAESAEIIKSNFSSDVYTRGYDMKYGDCDFATMFTYEESTWKKLLKECAFKKNLHLEALPRAAYIPNKSFLGIFHLIEALNISIPYHFSTAHRLLRTYCECPEGVSWKIYNCYYMDGKLAYQQHTLANCDKPRWLESYIKPQSTISKWFVPESSVASCPNGINKWQYFSLHSPNGEVHLSFSRGVFLISKLDQVLYQSEAWPTDDENEGARLYCLPSEGLYVRSFSALKQSIIPRPPEFHREQDLMLFLDDDGTLLLFEPKTMVYLYVLDPNLINK